MKWFCTIYAIFLLTLSCMAVDSTVCDRGIISNEMMHNGDVSQYLNIFGQSFEIPSCITHLRGLDIDFVGTYYTGVVRIWSGNPCSGSDPGAHQVAEIPFGNDVGTIGVRNSYLHINFDSTSFSPGIELPGPGTYTITIQMGGVFGGVHYDDKAAFIDGTFYYFEMGDWRPYYGADLFFRVYGTTTDPGKCPSTITPQTTFHEAAGGTGSVLITSSDALCNWSASTTSSWISITSGATGSGTGLLQYTTAAYTQAGTRTGTVTIAEQTAYIIQEGADLPELTITTTSTLVRSDTSAIIIEGTANDQVSGTMLWTNSLSGDYGSLAATSTWSTSVSLASGTNQFRMSGSNTLGQIATSTLNVVRVQPPLLQLYNTNAEVPYATASVTISGQIQQVETLLWTNHFTMDSNPIATDTSPFQALVPVNPGTNLITLIAQNRAGETTNSSIQIIRAEQNPILTVKPVSVSASASSNSTQAAHPSFNVSNTGGKTLNYTITYTTNQWLQQLSPTNGSLAASQTNAHTFSLYTTGVPLGTYTSTLQVTANDATINTSQLVTLTFRIHNTAAPMTSVLLQLLLNK